METPTRLSRPERKARTRDQLLDAAAAVFARYGYQAASLDQVAEAAGYTKGALYSNFESKEELFLALLDRRVERESAQLAAQVHGSGPAPAGETAQTPVGPPDEEASYDQDWLVLAVEFWLYAMRHEPVRERMASQYERFRAATAALTEEFFQARGLTPPLPPRDLATLIEAIGTGLGIQHALDPDGVDLELQRKALPLLLGVDPYAAPPTADTPRSSSSDRM